MARKVVLLIIILALIGLAAKLAYPAIKTYVDPVANLSFNEGLITLRPTDAPSKEVKEVPYKVEEFARGLVIPWSIVFTSPDRMLVTERGGRIQVIEQGKLRDKPLITFAEVSSQSEEGLMGMALDPSYETNKFIYVSLAYGKDSKLVVRVERLRDLGASIVQDKIILDNIPADTNHAGNRLRFSRDGKLFITTGDATEKNLAQDKNSLAGKILRLNSDGTIPSDNPFPNSPIFSLGHRNPQGIDWYPESNVLLSTEHGPSVFDGPAGGDEVNVIEAGENYGWPIVSHDKSQEGLISPKIVFTPAVAPASGMFYTGKMFPQFKNNFFFGALRGEALFRVIVDTTAPSQVASYGKMPDIAVGRIREVAQGPDGAIYFATSNRDNRGTVKDGDDKIYRIIKQ